MLAIQEIQSDDQDVESSILSVATNEGIEEIEGKLIDQPQIEAPLSHHFAPGIYMREICMPAGVYVIGHEHLTEHGNVVLSGKALVSMDGVISTIEAPHVFISRAGLRKVLIILEEMRFMTIHPNPTNERDIEKLEAMFVRKSATYLKYHEDLKKLLENK